MDLAEDALAELDIVIGSVHSYMNLEAAEMTDRLMRALESPNINALGHPTGRMILQREPFPFDFERVASEAVRRNVASRNQWQPGAARPERRNGSDRKVAGREIHYLNRLAPSQASSAPTCHTEF